MTTANFSCRLLEVDFSGIEAVQVGWFARSPDYIRLAHLGVHAGLASHILGKPYDASLLATHTGRAEVGAYFKEIKASDPVIYDVAKHTVHGTNYGLTEHGMVKNFPEQFPDLKIARQYTAAYRKMAPKIPAWQHSIREFADTHGYLGGNGGPPFGSPFGYKHWFWSIYSYSRISNTTAMNTRARCRKQGTIPLLAEINGIHYRIGLGEDAKRVLAMLPSSTAAGVLKEKMLALFADPSHESYIGDAYFGRTPLRAPIHDSLLLEVPTGIWDYVLEVVCREMLRPIPEQPCPAEWEMGPALSIGIDAKASGEGGSWEDCDDIAIPSADELGVGVAGDAAVWEAAEDEESEDVADLGVVA